MNEKTNSTTPLVYNGAIINQRDEMLSLTDMWRAAAKSGEEPDLQKQPAKWRALGSASEFVEHVGLVLGKNEDQLFAVTRGGRSGSGTGTLAHWQIGLAYAKYLSPEFHMWCNTVVRERMEGRQPVGIPAELRELIIRTDGISRMLSHKVSVIEQVLDRLEAAKVAPTFDYARLITSNQIIELAGVQRSQRVRGTSNTVTHAMLDFCNGMGCVRTEAGLNSSRPWRFPEDRAREWLFGPSLGAELIRNQISRRQKAKHATGQKSLRLVAPGEGATP